jgi:hypothetical protein
MLTFLRLQGRSLTASLAGAFAFAYGGFVAMHSVHLDLVEAAAWLVWAFVAVDRLARRPPGRTGLPWVALLGASLGLMALSGSAEPLVDGAVALVLYVAFLVWRTPHRRAGVLLGTIGGAALGACIGAAQLLPGGTLQSQSQRALHSYSYFASGSMNKSLTVLLFDPLLLGGAHGTPLAYIGTYNLPEISGYVGILPAMAFVGLLARRHRRRPDAAEMWIWYLIAVVGVLLVWGGFTPLGHVEHLIPLYNRQRLLARNWLEVDVALCVLFALWVDRMLLAPRPPPSSDGPRLRPWPSDVVLPLLVPAAVVVLQIVLLAGGAWFPHLVHVPAQVSYGVLWAHGVLLTVPSAVAVSAAWLTVRAPRLGARVPGLLALVVAADLLFFNAMAQSDPQLGTAAGDSKAADALAATVASADRGPGGTPPRVALFNPDRYATGAANTVGQPDLNVLRKLSSVQGYGAIVDAGYDVATGTHLQGNLSPTALADGTFRSLDLGVLLAPPQYFVHIVRPAPGVPIGMAPGSSTLLPPVAPDRAAPLPTTPAPATPAAFVSAFVGTPPPQTLGPGTPRTWYFGTVLAVGRVTVPVTSAANPATRLRIGLLSPDGTAVRWIVGAGGVPAGPQSQVTVSGFPGAAGLVVADVGPSPVTVGASVIDTAGQGTYRLDGGLRDLVAPSTWRWVGAAEGFGVFEETPAGAVRVVPAGAGEARLVSATAWGGDRVEVRATRDVTLVRDQEFATGWQATVGPARGQGPAVAAAVHRHGLVQAVTVPAGDHVVSFRYRPHRVDEGLAVSGAGLLVALGLVSAGWRRRRL